MNRSRTTRPRFLLRSTILVVSHMRRLSLRANRSCEHHPCVMQFKIGIIHVRMLRRGRSKGTHTHTYRICALLRWC